MHDIRTDYQAIAELVKTSSHILDIGCGDGELMQYLKEVKNVDARGIELSQSRTNKALMKGLCVIQADAEKEIFEYLSINKEEFPKEVVNLFEQPKMDKKYFKDLTNKFRSPHIWYISNNKWYLRKKIK